MPDAYSRFLYAVESLNFWKPLMCLAYDWDFDLHNDAWLL
jgi:hypothetical protein